LVLEKPKSDLGAEELIDAHVAVGGKQFLGAGSGEGVLESADIRFLAASAAVQGEGGDARTLAAGENRFRCRYLRRRVGDDEA